MQIIRLTNETNEITNKNDYHYYLYKNRCQPFFKKQPS